MEGPQPGESPDNEYMAMDPEEWEDQDDTYENGDTLGIDRGPREVAPVPGGATQPTNRVSRQSNDTPDRPQIPSRYITLRWPPPKGNIGSAKTEQLVFFQRTTLGLALLCLLLIAVVLCLSVVYNFLAGLHYNQSKELLQENKKLIDGIDLWCGARYYISNQTSQSELYVLNCEMFEEHMSQESFSLHYNDLENNLCKNWNCSCFEC